MAIKVIEVDLTQPFPSLLDLDLTHYPQLQILVRKNRQPIGYACLQPQHKGCLEENFLRAEINRQLLTSLNRVEFEQTLREGTELLSFDRGIKEQPRVTVAVCTRSRPESLHRALKSLTRLDYPAEQLELLVIDNAPVDDATQRIVAKFPQITYIVEPRLGLDWARNRAIKEAGGDIIAYTDDDVEVDPDWVQALAHHFINPAVMSVTGLVSPAELETEAQCLFEVYGGFGRGFETRYYTMGMQEYWRFWPVGAGIFGTGCNMAYRKSLFGEIGPFDEALDVGTPAQGAGDHDIFYRTIRAGYILVYEPRALIWHYHRRELAQLRRQLNDFGRGVYAYWTKVVLTDPEMRWRTLLFALIWYAQWFIKRLLRKEHLPRDLVWAEAIGALQGPLAYFLARRQANRIQRQFQTDTVYLS